MLVHSMANELVPHLVHSYSPPTSLLSSTSTLASPETKSMMPLSSTTGPRSSLIGWSSRHWKIELDSGHDK
ncbi:hypothetical protein EV1_018154 [Malus domestica]